MRSGGTRKALGMNLGVKPKVKAGGQAAGAAVPLVVVLAWLGPDMPAEVVAALASLITGGFAFLVGYLKEEW